jgi:uncharacterized membrane protein
MRLSGQSRIASMILDNQSRIASMISDKKSLNAIRSKSAKIAIKATTTRKSKNITPSGAK